MKINDDEYNLIIENQEDLGRFLNTISKIQSQAATIATLMLKLKGVNNTTIDPEEITFEDGNMYAKYTTYLCCGEYEDNTLFIPDHYLFDESWMEVAKAKIEQEKQLAAERARLKKAAEDDAKKKREYNEYLKLKNKFEGDV